MITHLEVWTVTFGYSRVAPILASHRSMSSCSGNFQSKVRSILSTLQQSMTLETWVIGHDQLQKSYRSRQKLSSGTASRKCYYWRLADKQAATKPIDFRLRQAHCGNLKLIIKRSRSSYSHKNSNA